uniref:Nonstructural protein n=1 Tax=Dulem virus 134 TaxID=3145611 RepID=A0AAU8AW51_9VIRU
MKFGVYSIRDVKVGFLNPTFEMSDAVSRRNFSHAVLNNTDSLFFSHPEDYSLYKIGTFDTETGKLLPLDVPLQLVDAISVIDGIGK